MKYLLSWVCCHLSIENWKKLGTIEEIIKKISLHTAEVSSYHQTTYRDLDIGIAKIIDATDTLCIAQYNDEEKIINLPAGSSVSESASYLVVLSEQKRYRLATMKDFHAETKNHTLPPIYGDIKENKAFLESLKQKEDYIIVIDSVSIGHRPDLFSHRGLARELAILFNQEMIAEKDIYVQSVITQKGNNATKQKKSWIKNKSTGIQSFSATQTRLNETPSLLEHIVALSAVDMSSHSFLVDTSNYVMLDIGQPMHVFDQEKIASLTFKDTIEGTFLGLDDTVMVIKEGDIVLEDENKEIVSLVGIMGGKTSEVSGKTRAVLIESVSPKKNVIKKTIGLHGKKTESALRMEKGTSIHAPEFALRRFLEIVRQYQSPGQCDIQTEYTEKIEEKTIITSKHYIENIIGIKLEDSFILSVLEKSGCKIEKTEDVLQVTPPWWRLDLYDQDTVTEEIARFFGYDHIPLLAPSIKAKIRKKDSFMLDLKKQTISLSQAKEIISYGIADEEIKKSWQMSQEKEVKLKNPYNDRLTSLTTTHVGNLLEIANKELKLGTKESRLFEINPTWAYDESEHIKEAQTYAFVGYSEDKKKDFYFYRDMLKGIYGFFGYELSFVKKEEDLSLYRHYSEIKSGIYLNNKLIGSCGLVDPLIIYKETKSAFLFFAAEINLSAMIEEKKNNQGCEENFLSFDISFLIQKTEKAHHLEELLKISFGYIAKTKIIDWFESDEWKDMRSVTLRIYVFSQDIDNSYKEIKEYLKERVCKIR